MAVCLRRAPTTDTVGVERANEVAPRGLPSSPSVDRDRQCAVGGKVRPTPTAVLKKPSVPEFDDAFLRDAPHASDVARPLRAAVEANDGVSEILAQAARVPRGGPKDERPTCCVVANGSTSVVVNPLDGFSEPPPEVFLYEPA